MMMQFDQSKFEMFLGAVRKYMQVRGSLSQKDLAELSGTGVSTMSRFLNQQTKELNPQMIAKIVATLNIPLHEIIDFVEEKYTEEFIRLVKFFKGDEASATKTMTSTQPLKTEAPKGVEEEAYIEALGLPGGGSQKTAQASIQIGNKRTPLAFQAEGDVSEGQLRDKLRRLSLKQKGFLNEFLNLDSDGRDLVADVGRNIISYLKQKGIDF
jgi:transcriptional regulator with XRE-family HTH domain